MPPKVSEDLHNVLGRSSDEQTYETELPIDLGTMFPTFSQSKNIKFQSMEIHHTTAEIRSSARQSGSNIKEYGAISTRCMESKQPGHSEPLTKHSNQYLRDPQEDAEPESTHNKYYTVEHQYSAQIEIDPSNRHNVEHQYCAEPQLHTRNYNTAHHYCAEPENQFSNRHHEVEHQYCADPVMHPSNRHQNCTEPESQTSNLSQKYCVDPECQSFKRHLAVEHQYCAELTHEPKCQESLHHDCVQPKTEPTQQEAKHICNAEPDNATAHPKTENEYCSKTEVALGIEEVEHRYSSELDKEEIPLETKHQYCLELDNEQAHCEAVHQYCDQPEMEPNNGHKIMEHNNEAYIVREHKEYSEHAADSHAETASQESPEPKEYIGQFQEKPEEPSELQGKCLKIGLGKGSDNYFEHDNEYVHVQNNQDTVSNTNPNNGFVEKTCKDYTEPELLSHCVVVSCKEEESESRINCIESGECLDAEPEAVHSDGCIAVYHDAYTIVEVGPINGTVGIFHENAKPDFNPSEDYMGSKQEKYAEPSYVPINGYCEDPSGETSNQCLVVYHGQYVEQATEPSHHIQEEDPEEYTLQLELLEAASEVTKDHILKHPEEGELAKNKLEQASCSMDGPDLSIESEQGLIKCTNPTVLWSAIAANKAHTCAECGKAFSRNSNLIIHRRTHTGEKPFKCAECDKSFVSSSKLIAHERTHTEPSPQKNYEQDLEVCVENVRSSQSPSKDQAHSPQWTEQDKTLMGKKKTGRKQKSIAGLEHASNVETGVKNSNSRKKPGRKKGAKKIHICIECGRNFSRLSNLVNHQRTHTGEKPYECSECGKRFSDVANMITHGRVHTGEKPFACGRCGKSFSRLSNMKTHQRMHTGEKPYPCNQCDKRFSHSSHLVTHQQLHTGERPHTCEECGKSFSRLANMLTHQKLHKGEKPYLCNVCFKRFNRSSHLTKHLQMHMREDLLMREDALRMEQQMCIREHIIILQ